MGHLLGTFRHSYRGHDNVRFQDGTMSRPHGSATLNMWIPVKDETWFHPSKDGYAGLLRHELYTV